MNPTRRNTMRWGVMLGLMPATALAQAPAPSVTLPPITGPFLLPPLPYAADANEPHIDARTMMVHHDRHHAAYVANLNNAIKDETALSALPVQTLLTKLHELPDSSRNVIRNNAGGHANHTMFWSIMGGHGGDPAGDLATAIDRDLGGVASMRTEFNRLGLAQFGSGWVFVTVTPEGKLGLTNRPNQDTPLMDGGRVLLGNDVWEHAYYLRYQNSRADYLAAWWNVVNWDVVADRYKAAKAGTLTV